MAASLGPLLVLSAVFSAAVLTDAVMLCPNIDFKMFQGYCYSFHTNEYVNNALARQRCQSKNAAAGNSVDLVSIHSAAENTFVYEEMKKKRYTNSWIGFYRKEGTDKFKWSDGSKVDYKNWAPGEPNNGNDNEDCTEMKYGSNQWNDMPCTSYMYGYVCKSIAVDEWKKEGNYEYYIKASAGDNSLNWYEARAWCNEQSGELASVHSKEDTDVIYKWLKLMGNSGNIWTGLNKLEKDRTKWTWSDYSDLDYTNWEYGLPKQGTYYKYCGAIKSNDPKGEWHMAHCDERNHGYVCKRVYQDNDVKTTRAPVTGGGNCPRGYTEAGNKCFFVDARTDHNGLTWREAVDYCRARTGYLADIANINNPLDQAVIDSMLQKSSHSMWIGLYRKSAGSKNWLWSDNSPNDFTNWGPGEPLFREFKCGTVRPYNVPLGSWGNWNCSLRQGVICQILKDPNYYISTPPQTTPNKCTPGYTPFWYGCYKLNTDLKSWDEADKACRNSGASLVSIHHGAENGFIQTLSLKQMMPVWIGLRDRENGEYTWSDNWATIYTKWGPDEPSQGPGGGCVRLDPIMGSWEDVACTTTNAYVCKMTDAEKITTPKPLEGRCPSWYKWVSHGSYCYKVVEERKTWKEAASSCVLSGIGSSLVSIHSLEENKWLYSILSADGLLTNHMWIGLYKHANTGGMAWTDNKAVNYENWAPGEPDGVLGTQDCVSFHKNYPGQWQDQPCETTQGYVCKAPKIQYPTVPTVAPGACPKNWVGVGSSCYLFQPNRGLEWMDAREECYRLSRDYPSQADLVVLNSDAEDAFVNVEMFARKDNVESAGNFWIGLAKGKSGSPYLWVDQSDPADSYKNWADDQPDGQEDGSQNCVEQHLGTGMWYDTSCSQLRGFVCQMDTLPTTQEQPKPGSGDGGLSGGQVAGIVIGVLALVAIVTGIVFYLVRNNTINNPIDKVRDMASGFSNPFYGSRDETIVNNPETA